MWESELKCLHVVPCSSLTRTTNWKLQFLNFPMGFQICAIAWVDASTDREKFKWNCSYSVRDWVGQQLPFLLLIPASNQNQSEMIYFRSVSSCDLKACRAESISHYSHKNRHVRFSQFKTFCLTFSKDSSQIVTRRKLMVTEKLPSSAAASGISNFSCKQNFFLIFSSTALQYLSEKSFHWKTILSDFLLDPFTLIKRPLKTSILWRNVWKTLAILGERVEKNASMKEFFG